MKLWSVDEKLNKIENTVVWGRNYREEWEDAGARLPVDGSQWLPLFFAENYDRLIMSQ